MPKPNLTQTKFFRVATSGPTIDGREITQAQIQEMAANYNYDDYGARVWLEHYRGVLADSYFNALGDVLALKTEKVEINGKEEIALLAKLAVTDDLIEINHRHQKIFTSIEITPNYAKTGTAYLSGLAVTDSPASLGTEALKFSRKNSDDGLFSIKTETTFEIEEVVIEKESFFTNLFKKKEDKENDAASFHELFKSFIKAVSDDYSNIIKSNEQAQNSNKKEIGDLKKQIGELHSMISELSGTPENDDRENLTAGRAFNTTNDYETTDC